jgi:hypothetical protein
MVKDKTVKVINKGGPLGGGYFLLFIGAAIYFVQHSDGFWGFVLAVLKACVWPAFIIHRAMELMGV